jgi:AcrR family transcriptional regulator
MNEKIEKGASTRDRIIQTARRLFTASGYDGTSTETVLRESGVSRGALYHHFDNKQALFAAVLEAVEADIAVATARASANIDDPVDALRAAFDAFLGMACEPEVRQIVLIDAHSVVGWQKWREIDERHGFGRLKAGLKKIAATGRMRPDLVDIFAHMLLASLFEVAFLIARSPDPAETLNTGRTAMNELLTRLLAVGVGPRPAPFSAASTDYS